MALVLEGRSNCTSTLSLNAQLWTAPVIRVLAISKKTSLFVSGNSGITAASFGVVGGVFALQFFSEVPKVRRDIMQVCLMRFKGCETMEAKRPREIANHRTIF